MSNAAEKDVSMVDSENGSDSEDIQDLAFAGVKKLVAVWFFRRIPDKMISVLTVL